MKVNLSKERLEKKAEQKFSDLLHGLALGEMESEKRASLTQSELRKQREAIADELEVILGGSLNYRIADMEQFIDRLRGDKE